MAEVSKQIGAVGLDEKGEPIVKEPIFVHLTSYRDSKFLDIRKYYKDGEEWKPTKKGIALHNDQLNKLLETLRNNEDEIKAWLAEG
ncbi:MAG: transcriptional coactivator p15/PC4 family protein [Spirochaetes bacterium]|nr:transcriptional coactivator p15/PC4 family protein [Spirochaetota bacterium]